MAARPKTTDTKVPLPTVTRRDMPSSDPAFRDRLYRFEGDNPRFNIPAPGYPLPHPDVLYGEDWDMFPTPPQSEPPMPRVDPNIGQPPLTNIGQPPPEPSASRYFNDPYSYLPDEPQPYSYIPESDVITAGTGAGLGSITNNPFNPNYGRTGGPNRSSVASNYNMMQNNLANSNIVPTAARVPVAPPPGYRPGIDPEWNYFPNSNPPATTMGQYPYGITAPPVMPITPSFSNALSGYDNFQIPSLDLSNLDLSGLGFSQPSTPAVQQGSGIGIIPEMSEISGFNPSAMPEIDYDLLASKINLPQISEPQFEMPDYSALTERLSGIESGLGGLENRFQNLQVPAFEVPEINYDLLAERVSPLDRQFIEEQNIPAFQMPDLTSLNERLSGIESSLSNIPTYDFPDYSQDLANIQSGLGGLDTRLRDFQMPEFEMPDYSQQFANIQSGLGGLGQQIGNMRYGGPSLEDIQGIIPSYDPYNPMLGPSDRPLGFAEGGSIRYQEGKGIAGLEDDAEMTEGNQQLIEATIMTIQGMAPDQATADAIINQFIGLYGQEAFMALREQVLNPDGQAQTQGMIQGFGGGMDDFVQGIAGSQDRIAASPGEYIVPADVVSQLGDGNSEEGSRKLDGMLERTRMAKTGTIEQAPPIDSRSVLPA